MSALSHHLVASRKLLEAGRLAEAEPCLREILRQDAGQGSVWYQLGTVCYALKKLDDAKHCFQEAVRLVPGNAMAWNHLGAILLRQRAMDGAIECFHKALALQPSLDLAYNNLGLARRKQGKWDEAAECFRKALKIRPEFKEAQDNLKKTLSHQHRSDWVFSGTTAAGMYEGPTEALMDQALARMREGKLDEAAALFQRFLQVNPTKAEGHNNLGALLLKQGKVVEATLAFRRAVMVRPDLADAHHNLGVALSKQGRTEDALLSLQEALKLRPQYPEAHFNLGRTLAKQGRWEEAVTAYRQALRQRPKFIAALNRLGIALLELGRHDEAAGCFREILDHNPKHFSAHQHLCKAYLHLGQIDLSLHHIEQSLHAQPNNAESRVNRAILYMLRGDYTQGLPEYEWRWKLKDYKPRSYAQPLWDGSPLEGRTIFLHPEQGLGDTLQFIRYAPLLKERGARVIAEAPPALSRTLATCPGIDQLVAPGSAPAAFDVHAPLLSLPRLLGTTPETIPANVPYLSADPQLVNHWRQELAKTPGFKIGITWQGNPKFQGDRQRSFPLFLFEPLARLASVRLVSLQKAHGTEQIEQVKDRFAVVDLGQQLDETSGPFMDTAAVMKAVDLVITCDTSIAHLAGALGVPVWLVLSIGPDWRWFLDREDTPWYPSMRLFRQRAPGDWKEAFQRMTAALAAQPRSAPGLRPIMIEVSPAELLDKVAILEIKSRRITDAAMLANVNVELAELNDVRGQTIPAVPELLALVTSLREANEALWDIEEQIRLCERAQDFGPGFVCLARSVYQQNDRRAALKRRINELLGSRLKEEKSLPDYGRAPPLG